MIYSQKNFGNTEIEYVKDIEIGRSDGYITCIFQSKYDGKIFVTCSDGNVYSLPNILEDYHLDLDDSFHNSIHNSFHNSLPNILEDGHLDLDNSFRLVSDPQMSDFSANVLYINSDDPLFLDPSESSLINTNSQLLDNFYLD